MPNCLRCGRWACVAFKPVSVTWWYCLPCWKTYRAQWLVATDYVNKAEGTAIQRF